MLLLLGAALAAGLWYEESHKGGTGPGCTAGQCSTTCPSIPEGLYDFNGTTWYIKGCRRYGITTQTQLARCFGPNPVINSQATLVALGGFGNADTPSFIGTVQDISAGCACPNL